MNANQCPAWNWWWALGLGYIILPPPSLPTSLHPIDRKHGRWDEVGQGRVGFL